MAKTTHDKPQDGRILFDDCRQAITTRFHGPSASGRSSRISATAEAGRVYVECDDALSIPQNHAAAARKLAFKFGWLAYNDFAMGGTGGEFVFVAIPKGGV